MSQPVNISDALADDARAISEGADRSVDGQIEFWAQLGKAIEPLLSGDQAQMLRQQGETLPLAQVLQSVDSPEGRARVEQHLSHLPFPHYAEADQAGFLIRTDEDGTKMTGKFVDGKFVPADQVKHEGRE